VHTSAHTRAPNGVGDDAHPVDLASDRNSYICVHQLTCLSWVFLWWAGVMGSVDIALSTPSPFFRRVFCFAFHVSESTFTNFGSRVIIIILRPRRRP